MVYYKLVLYELRFRDFPMKGMGVGVGVGENGWIETFGCFWKEIEVDGSVPIVEPQRAQPSWLR